MKQASSTKRALFTSALAMLVCVAMLVGTTFAWFTDSASTGVNKIVAGNLDVALSYKNAKTDREFVLADENTKVFDEEALWEPGHVEYVVLKVSNEGTLALKYKLGVNIASETGSTNVNDKAFKLSEYIRFAVLEGDATTAESFERADLVAAAGEGAALNAGYSPDEGHLTAKSTDHAEDAVTLVVWMPTTVGNEANYKEGAAAPTIDLGISVVATQDTVEADSFGIDYDEDATYPVADYAGLTKAFEGSGVYNVTGDIKAEDTLVLDGDNALKLNAAGKTISNEQDIWDTDTGAWSLVSARNSSNLTIEDGNFQAKENDCYAVDVQDGATVTIEDGTFVGNIHAVYVSKGTAYIKGGFYSVQQKYPQAGKENEFVLNCLDENRANGTAKIIVTGGTFVNFNPADCQAEGAHTNFVADGYKVVSEPQTNGDVWYTVVAE